MQNIGSTLQKQDFPDVCLHSRCIFWILFALQEAHSSSVVVLPFLSHDRGESSYASVYNFIKPIFFLFLGGCVVCVLFSPFCKAAVFSQRSGKLERLMAHNALALKASDMYRRVCFVTSPSAMFCVT